MQQIGSIVIKEQGTDQYLDLLFKNPDPTGSIPPFGSLALASCNYIGSIVIKEQGTYHYLDPLFKNPDPTGSIPTFGSLASSFLQLYWIHVN